jgi:hypothetical protein
VRRTSTWGALAGLGLWCAAATGIAPGLKTMAVSDIRAGMKGYGLSVFRGTEPERFDVEVIGVLHKFRPDQDLVLIRTPHPLLDHTGSVAGMSGSPVYLEDRLIGAYAYGWSYGKDPIAGVTPIANMLQELNRPRRAEAPALTRAQAGKASFPLAPPLPRPAPRGAAGGYHGGERRDAFWSLAEWTRASASAMPSFAAGEVSPAREPTRSDRATDAPGALVPCSTPVLLGGVTPHAASLLRQHFAPLGLEVLEAASGAHADERDGPAGYVDGGSIAVTLLRGDIQATAVGTVTHVDGQRLIAFGHPMLDAGEVGLPTATSRVLHVLASERSSFKMAEAIKPLGALIHDRQAAIVVDADVAPSVVPVSIRIRGLPGLPRQLWQVEAVNHRLLTPSLVLTALSSALAATVNDSDDMMFRAESDVQLAGFGSQRVVDEGFAPTGVAQLGTLARLRLFDLLEAAYDNPFGRARVERIDVTLDVRFGHDVSELVSAQLTSEELDPGEPAHVVITLQPYAGKIEQRLIELPISSNLAGEQLELEIAPGDQVRLEHPVPSDLGDVLENVKSGLPSTSLVVSLQRKARGMSLAGHLVRNLPGSMLDTLATSNDSARTPLFVTQDRLSLPLGRVVTGQAKLSLTVRAQARGAAYEPDVDARGAAREQSKEKR